MSTERELTPGGPEPLAHLALPDIATLGLNTAVSILGKAYGCGQCGGE